MKRLLFLVLLGSMVAPATAQVAWIFDGVTPGLLHDVYLDSAAHPGGAAAVVSPLPAPMTGALVPFLPAPVGGVGGNATNGRIYASDGVLITMDADPLYFGISPPPLLFPPAPAVLPTALGPITGLGCDPAAGVLWASTPTFFVPLPLVPPYLPLGPPLPIPGLVGAPITGLDHETSTGSLWAVDAIGNVFNFTPAGAPIGPQPVVTVPTIVGIPIRGLGVNSGTGPGTFPPPACSTQTGGHRICITDGIFVYDALPGVTPPLPASTTGTAGLAYGMTCLPDYQQSLGHAPCMSSPTVLSPPLVGTVGTAFVGPGALNGFALRGGPASSVVRIWVDLCPAPGGLPIPVGHTLWLNPFSTSLAVGSATTDAFGNATLPFSLVPAPAGIQLTFQWIFTDPGAPFGVCLSDAASFTTGLR